MPVDRTVFSRLAVLWLAAFVWIGSAAAQSGWHVVDRPIREVVADVAAKTGFHFLYRDALIAGRRVDLVAQDVDLIEALESSLQGHGLALRVDSSRMQILIVERSDPEAPPGPIVVRGVVLDDERGTRLPFATVTWMADGRRRGTAANEAGAFRLEVSANLPVDLTFSYVGYQSRAVRVDPDGPADQLPVRLAPEAAFGPEVIVSTAAMQTEVDTTWHHLLQAGIFSPLGESGVIRSLQTLPSVSVTTAASAGLNVRGSRADGFQVLLDGLPIYNQNHFFGLFDAFNADVLQTVGLYYSVAPASLPGPPGGTVSFVTRTGSQSRLRGSFAASNTSGKGTLEGPILGGRGSWLLSARRSYLDALNWFNADELIGLGLDVGRETSPLRGGARDLTELAVITGDAGADFFDVHGKAYYESHRGTRLMATGYVGGDRTLHDAVRLNIRRDLSDVADTPVRTSSEWGNAAAGLQMQVPIGSRAFLGTVAGFSRYYSDFSKDDFAYSDPARALILPTDTSDHVFRPFSSENELLELKLAQDLDVAMDRGTLSAGYALHRFGVDHFEASALHDRFIRSNAGMLVDAYAQLSTNVGRDLSLTAGARTHYFELGGFFRASPRVRVRLFPERRIALGAGYSRNHQFIHRLYLEPTSSADIWVMSEHGQPPTSVDHLTAGAYVRISPSLFAQVEGYRKTFRNLREHVASAARRRLRASSPILAPWLHDNDGLAHGLEFMVRAAAGPLLLTTSYTLSSMHISNPRVNDARSYPADWDRRHQISSHVRLALGTDIDAHAIWSYGSGTPNALALGDPREPERLAAYHRLDLGVEYTPAVAGGVLGLRASIFNVYDRDNTWYRRPLPVIVRGMDGPRHGLVTVDVYDLGFQPSFEMSFRF